jgi:hypothetical protein
LKDFDNDLDRNPIRVKRSLDKDFDSAIGEATLDTGKDYKSDKTVSHDIAALKESHKKLDKVVDG